RGKTGHRSPKSRAPELVLQDWTNRRRPGQVCSNGDRPRFRNGDRPRFAGACAKGFSKTSGPRNGSVPVFKTGSVPIFETGSVPVYWARLSWASKPLLSTALL